jgi:hypothetical protein
VLELNVTINGQQKNKLDDPREYARPPDVLRIKKSDAEQRRLDDQVMGLRRRAQDVSKPSRG